MNMCYNEKNANTSVKATLAIIAHMTQKVYRLNGCWSNYRKEYRHDVLWVVTTE